MKSLRPSRVARFRLIAWMMVVGILLPPSVAYSQDGPALIPPVFPIPGDSDASITLPEQAPERSTLRLQSDFPTELILPEPSRDAKLRERRFIPSTIDPELPLRLVVGRPKVLQLAETPIRIFTPTDSIIRTEIIDEQSGKEVAVTGLEPGTTTLILWFEDPQSPNGQASVAYEVRVFDDPLLARPVNDLQRELNEKFPNSYIELDEIADRLIVGGQVPDVIEMTQILSVLLGTRSRRSTVNRETEADSVAKAFNFTDTGDRFESTASRLGAERAEEFANRLIDPQALAAAGIINQLKVVGEQQVMLKVTVAEVNRNAARSIGLNFSVENDAGDTVFRTLTGNLLRSAVDGSTSQSGANILASLDMGQVNLVIEALRRLNLSRTLAEPNLVTMNGEPADFQAGGQFPIPVISSGGVGNNLQGVSFVPFGVQLQFTPFIQDRDVIRLEMDAEVSTRDESLGTSIGGGGGGTQVSGLNSRNFSTTVQLRSGQTVAVAGLLQTNYGASTERVPLWGDLPIIGATGGINRSSSGEQELVILVTPHLVAPVDACAGPALPGSDVYEPTDVEFYIKNRLESRRSRDYRATVRTDHARQKRGEHCCVDQYLIGDIGPTDRCCPSPVTVSHRAVPATGLPSSEEDLPYFDSFSDVQGGSNK